MDSRSARKSTRINSLIPVTCTVTGYLSDYAWEQYQKTGYVSGVGLPEGLKENFPLPEPIFSATFEGNENSSIDKMIEFLSKTDLDSVSEDLVERSIDAYKDEAVESFNKGSFLIRATMTWGISTAGQMTMAKFDGIRLDVDKYGVGE